MRYAEKIEDGRKHAPRKCLGVCSRHFAIHNMEKCNFLKCMHLPYVCQCFISFVLYCVLNGCVYILLI